MKMGGLIKGRRFGIAATILTVCILLLAGIALLRPGKGSGDRTFDGSIQTEGKESPVVSGLFYRSNEKYLIDMESAEKLIKLDFFKKSDCIIIRSSKNQISLSLADDSYTVNGNRISEDEKYVSPFMHDGIYYIDSDAVFRVFGYTASYDMNAAGTQVRLVLTGGDGDIYESIVVRQDESGEKTDEILPASVADTGLPRPGGNQGVVLRPAEPVKTDGQDAQVTREQETETDTVPEDEELPPEVQRIIDERPGKQEDAPVKERSNIVDRPDDPVANMSEEELESLWDKQKTEIQQIYAGGTPSSGNVSLLVRNEDFFAFNPMTPGLYYDTIYVLHNPADGAYEEIVISGEWSDQAGNTDNPESIAYYLGVPHMVEATMKTFLGENMGGKLFLYVKDHADRMPSGGYISVHDEAGNIVSQWSDGPVGDGISAGELDLDEWQGRYTDNGLRFNVCRNGSGLSIRIYKD